ncbi:MAG: DUF1287 domain-containing protein [Erysipelotrichaceae bacterium]|nr:DUF1287 domain-containing protein [Erysipelotrichaceae bacterium]MCI9312770.1 DUF1287 domain-containing protein [Erysipelotrichaceae bacterium]
MNKHTLNRLLAFLCVSAMVIVLWILYLYNIIEHASYTDADFNLMFQPSGKDENQNGVDDFLDILAGAKLEAQRRPTYRSAYYAGGYPPENEGVCTDVIWRSLAHAGYDLKELVDRDIAACVACYPRVNGAPDPNIDFRRVPNLQVFLRRHALSLTCDINEIGQWQAGDIVVFADSHIAIISDQRNHNGIPFLIHNGNLPKMEEDGLWREAFLKGISGHYRFVYHEEVDENNL